MIEVQKTPTDLEELFNTDIDDIPLTFGKYAGYTPNQIDDELDDGSYIIWLYETLETKYCSLDLYNNCQADSLDENIQDLYNDFTKHTRK